MDILIGVLVLVALAGVLTLALAAFDDKWARRLSGILLARADAREAYRERYSTRRRYWHAELGLTESPEVQRDAA